MRVGSTKALFATEHNGCSRNFLPPTLPGEEIGELITHCHAWGGGSVGSRADQGSPL